MSVENEYTTQTSGTEKLESAHQILVLTLSMLPVIQNIHDLKMSWFLQIQMSVH